MADRDVAALIQRTLERLCQTLPQAALELGPFDQDGFVILALPAPQRSDYRFGLSFADDGERQMHATLFDAPGRSPRPPHNTFWYWPFELAADGQDPARLADDFDAALEALLSVPTRIRQERGRFAHRFLLECAVSQAVDSWVAVYGYAASRSGGFVVPPNDEHAFIYHSPTIAPRRAYGPEA